PYPSASNLVCGLIDPFLLSTIPRSTSSRLVPRSSTPTLSPACPWSSSLRNISTPVHTVERVSPSPTISISSPTLTTPRSIRPVATVPRPVIVNTSSTGIRYGLFSSRLRPGGERVPRPPQPLVLLAPPPPAPPPHPPSPP